MNRKPGARTVLRMVADEHGLSEWEAQKICEQELGSRFETQRAKYAAQILQGMCAGNMWVYEKTVQVGGGTLITSDHKKDNYVKRAVDFTDALLLELQKTSK